MARCAQACDLLLEECLNRGAVDNLSALLLMCGVGVAPVRDITAETSGSGHLSRLYPESSLKSPEGSSMPLGSPSSGAKDRTPTDKTLSSVFSTEEQELDDQMGTSKSVNRHLEFARDLR
jgi:hypothetical protein